jgi:hypothetical protein
MSFASEVASMISLLTCWRSLAVQNPLYRVNQLNVEADRCARLAEGAASFQLAAAQAQSDRDLGRAEPAIPGPDKTTRSIQDFCLRRNGESPYSRSHPEASVSPSGPSFASGDNRERSSVHRIAPASVMCLTLAATQNQ